MIARNDRDGYVISPREWHAPLAWPEQWLTESECRLIRENLGLAKSVAIRSRIRSIDFDDRIQIARLALARAARGFDPARGHKFAAYAARAMRSELACAVRDSGLVRVPRYLQSARTKRERRPDLLAAARKVMAITRLDDFGADDEPRAVASHGAAGGPSVEALIEEIGLLPPRMRSAIKMGLQGYTYGEIGERIGEAEDKIRWVHRQACSVLRERLAATAAGF